MPQKQYDVTAPDGRTLTLTGDHPPTEDQLDAAFASMPPKPGGMGGGGGGGAGSTLRGLNEALLGGLAGGVKGLAKTATAFTGLVPGLNELGADTGNKISDALTRILYGEEAVPHGSPITAAQAQRFLSTDESTSEKVGRGIEQAGEFFVPAGAARRAAITPLAMAIPGDLASMNTFRAAIGMAPITARELPGAVRQLNKLAAVAGRTAGEAGSAGVVADLQGEDAGRAAMLGATGPLAGEAGAELMATLKNPAMQRVVPYLTAILAGKAFGGLTESGIGAGLTGFGLSQALAREYLRRPGTIPTLQKGMRVVGPAAARLAAGSGEKREPRP